MAQVDGKAIYSSLLEQSVKTFLNPSSSSSSSSQDPSSTDSNESSSSSLLDLPTSLSRWSSLVSPLEAITELLSAFNAETPLVLLPDILDDLVISSKALREKYCHLFESNGLWREREEKEGKKGKGRDQKSNREKKERQWRGGLLSQFFLPSFSFFLLSFSFFAF